MASKVGVAILGLGRQGAPRLEKVLGSTDRMDLRWIVDKDVEAAKSLSRTASLIPSRPQVCKPWKWDDVINDKSVDAVLVCGPHASVNMVRKALKRGKSVMCDRPISLHTQAILACYEEAIASRKHLMFGFIRRFDETLSEIQKRVQDGEIGKVNTIRSSVCFGPPDSDNDIVNRTSIFRDCVSQEIDTVTWLLDQLPTSVFATGSGLLCDGHPNAESESVSMTMRFPSGTIATVDISRAECAHEQQLEISGTHGTLIVDPHHPDGTAIHSVTKRGSTTNVLTLSREERHEKAFASSVNHFLDIVQDKDKPRLTILDTLRATSIAARCEESHLSNAAVARETQKECQRPETFLEMPVWKECPEIFPSSPVYMQRTMSA
jgi:myo-inositol 2-dehydrogenase/D-chiro-inositol 1-dehydrogenase